VLELRDGRYHFQGRRDGVINVGGLKVHPEKSKRCSTAILRLAVTGQDEEESHYRRVSGSDVLLKDPSAPEGDRRGHCNRTSRSSAVSRWRRIRCRRRSTLLRVSHLRDRKAGTLSWVTFIVTGGSRGIGLGIVRRLAKTGHSVMAVARKESPELRAAIDEAARSGTGSIGFAAYDLAEIRRHGGAGQATP